MLNMTGFLDHFCFLSVFVSRQVEVFWKNLFLKFRSYRIALLNDLSNVNAFLGHS